MAASERSFRTMDTNYRGATSLNTTIADKYASFDRKAIAALKKLEKIIFSAMYTMVQENNFRIKYSFVGVIIDFLQVFAFTLSQDFGFGKDYEVISSFILAPLQLLDWTAFEVFFWLVTVVIVSSFAVAGYVGYTFLQSDFTVVWPIKYMRTMVNLILSVLFIPCLTVLVVPLKADPLGSGYLKHFVSYKIVAWGPFVTPYAVIAILLITIFVPFCLLMGLLSFEFAPNTKDYMARSSSWLDFVYLLLKTMLVFVTNFASSDAGSLILRATIILLATGFVLAYLIVLVPYYGRYMNVIRASLFGALFGAAISTAVKSYAGVEAVAAIVSEFGIFGIHIGATLIFGGLGGLIMYVRLASKTTGNPYKYVTRKPRGSGTGSSVPTSPTTSLREIGVRGRRGAASSMSGAGAGLRTAGTSLRANRKSGFFKRQYTTFKNFYLASEMILRVLFLRLRPESDDTVHLADTVYQRMIDANRSVGALYIHYANFLLSYKNDWLAASAQVRKAEVIGCGFTQRWLCFGLYKRIDRQKRSVRMGTGGSTDLMKYVEFQHVLARARRAHLDSLRHLRLFWECLIQEEGDRQMSRMAKANSDASTSQARAMRAYSKVISTFPNSPVIWRSMASFLIDVVNEPEEGRVALQTADELEEKQSRSHHAATHYQEVGPSSGQSPAAVAKSNSLEGIPEAQGDAVAGVDDDAQSTRSRTRAPVTSRGAVTTDDDDTASDRGSSVGTHSTHESRRTGGTTTSDTSATTLSRRLMAQLTAGAGAKKLQVRFMQTFFIFVLLIVVNFVVTRVLIDAQTSHVHASHDVIFLRMDSMLGAVATSELAIAYYTNETGLGQDKLTKWKVLPQGQAAHKKLAEHYLEEVRNLTDKLLSEAPSDGWGVDVVWQTGRADMVEYPSQKHVKTGLKDAIDEWRLAAKDVINAVVNKEVPPADIFKSDAFPTMLWNGIEEIGGTHAILGHAYEKALVDSTDFLQIVIIIVAVVAGLIVAALAMLIIAPTVRISHLEEHLVHVFLTMISTKHIENILKHIMSQEMELRQQLTESGVDSDDEADVHVAQTGLKKGGAVVAGVVTTTMEEIEAEIAEKRKKKKKKVASWMRSGNVEGALYREADRQRAKCNGMRAVTFLYVFALAAILSIMIGQCINSLVTMNHDIVASHTMIEAGDRLEMCAGSFAYVYWLPKEMDDWCMNVWTGTDPHKHMEHELVAMKAAHDDITYGNAAKGITGTHEYIKENQHHLVEDIIKPGVDDWLHSMHALLKANQTTLDYSLDEYWHLQHAWDQPGKFKIALEDSVKQYYDKIIQSHDALGVQNVIWMIAEIVCVFVMYVFVINRALDLLLDRDEGVIGALKALPIRAIADTPLLIEYLRDKNSFLEKIKDRASVDADDGLDEIWTQNLVKYAPEGYIVINHNDEILEMNPSAEKALKASGREVRMKNIEIIAAPGYRTALKTVIKHTRTTGAMSGGSIMAQRSNNDQMPLSFRVRRLVTEDKKMVSKVKGHKDRNLILVLNVDSDNASQLDRRIRSEPSSQASPAASQSQGTGKVSAQSHVIQAMWTSVPILLIDLDGQIVQSSKAACRVLDIDIDVDSDSNVDVDDTTPKSRSKASAGLEGSHFVELFSDKSKSEAGDLLQSCLSAEGHEMTRILTVPRPRGREGTIRVTLMPTTYSRTSEVRNVLALFDDRSDMAAIQRSLLVHERQHRELLKYLPIGVVGTDRNGTIITFNDSASVLLGHSRSAVLGHDLSLIFVDPFESWAEEAGKDDKWITVNGRRDDGTSISISVTAMIIDSKSKSRLVATPRDFRISHSDSEVFLFLRELEASVVGRGDQAIPI